MPAQKSAQARLTSQRPKRGKGTFFCITGKNSLMGNLNSSNLELFDQDEGDKFLFSPTSRSFRNFEGNFTDIANSYNLRNEKNSHGKFSSSDESDSTYLAHNGRFKLISIV